MTISSKRRLLERAEDEGLEVTDRGGGWFEIEGRKVRGLDALEDAIEGAGDDDSPTRCLCGCGEDVSNRFRQGHDARLKGVLLRVARGEQDPDEIPEEALPHLEDLDSLLGPYEEDIEDVLEALEGAD